MMSDVRWKVSLLFVIITLSIFFSIYLGSDSVISSVNKTRAQASGGNATNTSVLTKSQIPDLIYQLETGNNDSKYDAASKLGRLGKPAASALVDEIGTNNSSLEGSDDYMLLALLETKDDRAEKALSDDFAKKAALNNSTVGSSVEGQPEKKMSEDTMQVLEAKDKDMKNRLANSLNSETKGKTVALENALRSDEQNSSIYTTFAFSEFGPQEPGSENEKLLKALKSGNGSIRIAAAIALGENKEQAAVDPLDDLIDRDYLLVKNSAIIALGEIGDERPINTLLKQVQSDSEFTRCCTVIAVGKIGSEQSLPYLVSKLRDPSSGVRSNSALSLMRIGDETAVEPLIGILESGKIVQGRANDSINAVPDVRKCTILALGELRDSRATEDLIGIMNDKEEKNDIRLAAASALGEIGDSRATDALKTVLNDKTVDNEIKNKVLLILSKTKSQEIAVILVGEIGDKEFGDSARVALINMGETAVDPLIGNLKTTDNRIKNETALILIEIGDPRAIKPLVEAYKY